MANSKITYTAKRGLDTTNAIIATGVNNESNAYTPSDNLIINGTFEQTGNWLMQTGWTISNGKGRLVNTTGADTNLYQLVTIPEAGLYLFGYDIVDYQNGTFKIGYAAGTTSPTDTSTQIQLSNNGKLTRTFEFDTPGTIYMHIRGVTRSIANVDNVFMYNLNYEIVGDDPTELHTSANAASITNEANAVTGFSQAGLTGGNYFFADGTHYDGTWSVRGECNPVPTGAARFYMDLTNQLSLVDDQAYRISFYLRHVGTGGQWTVLLSSDTASANQTNITSITNTDTTFTEYTIDMVYKSTNRYLVIREDNVANDGGVYFDALSITKVNQLIDNGGFNYETPGKNWTLGTGWSIGSGVATISGAGGTEYLQQLITFPTTGTYEMAVECTAYSAGSLYLDISQLTAQVTYESHPQITATGWYRRKIYVHAAGTMYVRITAIGTPSASFDNFSCWLIEDDISAANDNGFEIHGALDIACVAPGSELRAFNEFSLSSYLYQPYTSAYNVGTGDFTYNFWYNQPGSGSRGYIFERSTLSGSTRQEIYVLNTGYLYYGFNGSGYLGSGASITFNAWNMYTITRVSGTVYLYINGVEVDNATFTSDVDDTSAYVTLGLRSYNLTEPALGSLALFKFSDVGKTAAEVKAIYDKEKTLFEPFSIYQLVGLDYEIETAAESKTQRQEVNKAKNVTLDGTIESVVNRTDYYHTIETDLIPYYNLSAWREFLYSCRGDETFTFYPGGGVEPNQNITCSLDSTQHQETRIGGSTYIRLTLNLKER